MPAPAVIPAPIAYINAAAVKKLVVVFRALECSEARWGVDPPGEAPRYGLNPEQHALDSKIGRNGTR